MEMMRSPQTRAFTLIELLVVMVVIAILATLLIGGLQRAREKARRTQLKMFIHDVENAAKSFQLATNRWPWDIAGKTLNEKLNAGDIFVELAPATSDLTPVSYAPLLNKERAQYLKLGPERIKNGKVIDLWGNELELYWNPDTQSLLVVAPGENRKNETVLDGKIQPAANQGDDVNNL